MTIPVPNFIDRDPQQITRECISYYETELQKTLYPAQPERILINGIAYRETLVRLAIQWAAEQCLVNFATGDRLDQLGLLVGVTRLPAARSITTLEFTKTSSALGQSVIIPSGFLVASPSGFVQFEVDRDLLIGPGVATGTVGAIALNEGVGGNDLAVGALSQAIAPNPSIQSVTNLSVTSGGAEIESDSRLRERIKLAPNQFSVAGSRDSYRYHTLSADVSIIDAAIFSPSRVRVQVYPLLNTGIPSAEILGKVAMVLSAETVRPLTDEVEVLAPIQLLYSIQAGLVLFETADLDTTLNAALENLNTFLLARERKLGQDIVRSQIISILHVSGVYQVNLAYPAADQVINPSQWARCSSRRVEVTGVAIG